MRLGDARPLSTPALACAIIFIAALAEILTWRMYLGSACHGRSAGGARLAMAQEI
jgi:hypothetical protein